MGSAIQAEILSLHEHTHPLSAEASKQGLRMRRFVFAVGCYAVCDLFMFFAAWRGGLPSALPWAWGGLAIVTNGVFFLLLRSGLNQRFSDPSLTVAQLATAVPAAAILLYYAGAARASLLMAYPVCCMFGALRLTMRQMLAYGVYAAGAHAVVVGLLFLNRPHEISIEIELLQWVALVGVLSVVCPFMGYLSNVRRRLSRSLRTIEELARCDALTGVYNRHHLLATLERDIGRAARGEAPFLLAMVDIDHFKAINDQYGHLTGDGVLQAVARQIRSGLRSADYVARYGGEEFVLILAAGQAEPSTAGCERIRADVERLALPELGGRRLTISMGVTAWSEGDTLASLLARADAALYRAKSRGRNRVEWQAPALS